MSSEEPSDVAAPRQCNDHSRPLGPILCERCGVFLCEDCLNSTAFTAFCSRCIARLPYRLPRNDRSPVKASQIALRYLNMGLFTAFFLATIISFFTSFESGFESGVSIFGFSFILILFLVWVLGLFVLIFTILVSPGRASKLAQRRGAAIALLREHCLAMSENQSIEGRCFRCRGASPERPGELCQVCLGPFEESLCQFDPPPATLESPPPWTLQTRILIALLVVWVLIINLVLGYLPAPTRSRFQEWRMIPNIIIGSSLFAVFQIHSRILHSMALAPLTSLFLDPEKNK